VISGGSGQHARDAAPARTPGLLPWAPPAPAPVALLGAAVDWAVVAIGAAMIVLVFVNVVMHVFHRDLAWVIELSELLMVWVTFLGGAAAARRGSHMRITEFIDKLHGARRIWADAAIEVLALAVLALLIRYGWGIVGAGWTNRLTVLDWPMAFQYLALPVGAGAAFVFVAWDLVLILQGRSHAERFGAPADPAPAVHAPAASAPAQGR
jgi:TRAP-type C4-dicarboxylate transport system permease small subunit